MFLKGVLAFMKSRDKTLKGLINIILNIEPSHPWHSREALKKTRIWLLKMIPGDMRTDELLERVRTST